MKLYANGEWDNIDGIGSMDTVRGDGGGVGRRRRRRRHFFDVSIAGRRFVTGQ